MFPYRAIHPLYFFILLPCKRISADVVSSTKILFCQQYFIVYLTETVINIMEDYVYKNQSLVILPAFVTILLI